MKRFIFLSKLLILILFVTTIVFVTGSSFQPSNEFLQTTQELAENKGCLSCHEGIERINPKMDFIQNLGGVGKGCVVCHEGNPTATSKENAHKGLLPNPGAMWVVSEGKGCAKCHSDNHVLTTIQGEKLPKPVGGSMLQIVSQATDPSGASGGNHVYRMQRALMSLEFGKASHTLMSNGVVPKGEYIYADFVMDDPDGFIPTVGSSIYKKWITKAIKEKFIKPITKTKKIPDFHEGMKIWNNHLSAAFSDYYRKECARCHVWEEGRQERGDLRAGGCSACHVLYTNDGFYEGNDPTIPKKKGVHHYKHEITLKIPASQCNHCHTRGKRIGTSYVGAFEFDYKSDKMGVPFDAQGNPQELLYTKDYIKVQEDIHIKKGMQCIDCHTSIDVHGDGNIYPTTLHQVEINCADCHGTPQKYPWEIAVGYNSPVLLDNPRGTYSLEGKEYLLTSRGNPRTNLQKIGNKVILTSLFDAKEHEVPLLKDKAVADSFKTKQGKVAMLTVHQHIDKLECYACHSNWAPQCYGCHTKYDRRKKGIDWIETALNRNPHTGKQVITETDGKVTQENRSFLRWEEPILGINLKGKVSPVVPGCQVIFTYINENGEVIDLNKIATTSDGFSGLTMAPVHPHTNTIPARTCESCHTNPKTLGYGIANSRSQGELNGDAPLFTNLAEGFYGGIPDSKTERWQVPKIKEFPYSLEQLVTRSGKQIQNMPHVEDRPLNTEERNKVEREGSCIACHQHYNTPIWNRIIEKLKRALKDEKNKDITKDGKAVTPELHDKALEILFKEFGKE